MTEETILQIPSEQSGRRLDTVVAELAEISRTRAQALIADGMVEINGKTAKKRDIVQEGDWISYELPELEEIEAVPQDLPIEIVYEDEHLLVVNKPQGMVVHPAPGNPDGTLVNALLFHCKGRLSSINGKIRPGIVHRIDKDTSGLLIVAKTDAAHTGLAEQIAVHNFVRKYEAVCAGHFSDISGTVDAPIGRHSVDRKKMAVTDNHSKNAVTHYRVLGENAQQTFSLVELTLETGRTHQIRVHMAYIHHPVIGDPLYSPECYHMGLKGQCLFAKYIEFKHPITGEILSFEAERPAFLLQAIQKLGISESLGD